MSFIDSVTDPASASFVPPSSRIATLDMDGTLLCEKPDYFEVFVATTKLCQTAQANPSLLEEQPYKAACEGDTLYINQNVETVLLTAFEGATEAEYSAEAGDPR